MPFGFIYGCYKIKIRREREITRVGYDVEQKEPSCTLGGIVN